jgi:hypothetical protein
MLDRDCNINHILYICIDQYDTDCNINHILLKKCSQNADVKKVILDRYIGLKAY